MTHFHHYIFHIA